MHDRRFVLQFGQTWPAQFQQQQYGRTCQHLAEASHLPASLQQNPCGCNDAAAGPICQVLCGWLLSTLQHPRVDETSAVGKCQRNFDGGTEHRMMIEKGRTMESNQETRWCLPWSGQRQMRRQAENQGQRQGQRQKTANARSQWQSH